jgi:hypothetical protein
LTHHGSVLSRQSSQQPGVLFALFLSFDLLASDAAAGNLNVAIRNLARAQGAHLTPVGRVFTTAVSTSSLQWRAAASAGLRAARFIQSATPAHR